jgi:hypothetical protein
MSLDDPDHTAKTMSRRRNDRVEEQECNVLFLTNVLIPTTALAALVFPDAAPMSLADSGHGPVAATTATGVGNGGEAERQSR